MTDSAKLRHHRPAYACRVRIARPSVAPRLDHKSWQNSTTN